MSGASRQRGFVRRVASALTPDAIEQIAQRVAELLRDDRPDVRSPEPARRLLDAARLARLLGVTRQWVYEHANELGAVRLGDGSRPRLRFDPAVATQVLERRRRGGLPDAPPPSSPGVGRPRRRRTSVPLLPVAGPAQGDRRIVRRVRSVIGWRRR